MHKKYPDLVKAIFGQTLPGKKKNKTYHCSHVDQHCIIFEADEAGGKAIIPTEVAIEWIEAFEAGLVYDNYTSKERVKEIGARSDWSNYCHGFTSHLDAIVRAYQNSVNS